MRGIGQHARGWRSWISGTLWAIPLLSFPKAIHSGEPNRRVGENSLLRDWIFEVASQESIGGNAGRGHVAVNFAVDAKTDRILTVGFRNNSDRKP